MGFCVPTGHAGKGKLEKVFSMVVVEDTGGVWGVGNYVVVGLGIFMKYYIIWYKLSCGVIMVSRK